MTITVTYIDEPPLKFLVLCGPARCHSPFSISLLSLNQVVSLQVGNAFYRLGFVYNRLKSQLVQREHFIQWEKLVRTIALFWVNRDDCCRHSHLDPQRFTLLDDSRIRVNGHLFGVHRVCSPRKRPVNKFAKC